MWGNNNDCLSHRSHSSISSDRSNLLLARTEVAAEAAVLRARMRYHEEETRLRVELERVQIQQQLEAAEARLKVIDAANLEKDVEDEPAGERMQLAPNGKDDFLDRYLNARDTAAFTEILEAEATNMMGPVSMTVHDNFQILPPETQVKTVVPSTQAQTREKTLANQEVGTTVPPDGLGEKPQAQNSPHQSQSQRPPSDENATTQNPWCTCKLLISSNSSPRALDASQQLVACMTTLVDQLNLSRLPPPEPGTFSGDPLAFPSWKGAFETLIESKRIPATERLHYMRRYLSGPARECVEGFLYLNTETAYHDAKALLEKRYGDPFTVTNAFRNKLEAWNKIPPRDGAALRKFFDFLKQCLTAMKSINTLGVLNDERENKKVLAKLPDWMITRWGRTVAEWRQNVGRFPTFKAFSMFVEREADIACDPVISLQAIRNGQEDKRTNQPCTSKDKGRPQSSNSFATEMGSQDWKQRKCLLCKGNHSLDFCHSFLSKTLDDKKKFAWEKKLCFGCLKPGHRSKNCRHRLKCKECSKMHPTALHGDKRQPNPASDTGLSRERKDDDMPKKADCKCTSTDTEYSAMIVPVWIAHKDEPLREQLVYAMLDSQSDTTFILEKTRRELGLEGTETKLLLSTMTAADQLVPTTKVRGLVVRGMESHLHINLPPVFSRDIMPASRCHIPTPETALKWPHLQDLAGKLHPLQNCDVRLLIGYNCSQALLPREVVSSPDGEKPFAQRTDLGWSIIGPGQINEDLSDNMGTSHRVVTCEVPQSLKLKTGRARDQVAISLPMSTKEVFTPSSVTRMMELDFSEIRTSQDGDIDFLSQDDRQFMNILREGVVMGKDGHYEMPLPFKGMEPILPDNKPMALKRLNHLKSRFKRDHNYWIQYKDYMSNVIKNEVAEMVPDEEIDEKGKEWYIPHFGVYHPKKPKKIRVVYDCSAKYDGTSLNSHLLNGPDLTNTLVGVLCRFRQESIAFMCDIEAMFHQFHVAPQHRNYLRFLWWEDGNFDTEPKIYRMKVHLFGAASSPGCANLGLKQAAMDNKHEFGTEAADFICHGFYVDDGLKSVPTIQEALQLIKGSKGICAKGGLRLHKFLSNSKKVIASIPVEDQATGIKVLNLSHDVLPIERALGVHWCIESDTFMFRITLKDKPLTRRGVLSTVSSIYDPLGFVAPLVLVGKTILQEMCKNQPDWDDPLPDDLKGRWEQWRSSLPLPTSAPFFRCQHYRVWAVFIHSPRKSSWESSLRLSDG
ncbi:uncharacterized protein LOC135490878 [Lineus longissimus]|uniref:uncharacterized protein LOC135490878 n=1 Tax=Lineus longissimus TaxID=88925 RepID=UPI00315D07AF